MMEKEALLILIRLLSAYVIVEFLLQPKKWVISKQRDKYQSKYLYYHTLILGVVTWLFLADPFHVGLPIFIMVAHFFIDFWKTYQHDNLQNFLIDQALHLLTIASGWALYLGWTPFMGYWIQALFIAMPFWIILLGFILAIWPTGLIVDKFTEGWRRRLKINRKTGLPEAGKWIGRTERILILIFVLLGAYQAIGFLIAAKSIFRFNGITERKDREEAEYILVGTFLSFTIAIIIGLGMKYLLSF